MPPANWEFRLVRREFNGCHLDNDLKAGLCKLLCKAFPRCWRIIDISKRSLGNGRFTQQHPLSDGLVVPLGIVFVSTSYFLPVYLYIGDFLWI
jgi:hypothetical protein